MYCTVCGNEVKETTRFCPICGASSFQERNEEESRTAVRPMQESEVLASPASSFQERNEEESQTAVRSVQESKVWVSPASDSVGIKADLEKALAVIQKIEKAIQTQEEFDRRKEEIAKKKKEIADEYTTAQWIGLAVLVIAWPAWNWLNDKSFILTAVIGGVIFCFLVNPILKFFSPNEERADQYYKENMEIIEREEAEFMAEFEKYCESDEVAFARQTVPEEYFDSDSVQFFIKMLTDKRADSFKEAVNLYEEYLHREYMENMQREQLSLQGQQLQQTQQLSQQMQAQTAYMQQISNNTKATAKAAKANAFISLAYGHGNSKKLKRIERNSR